MIMKSANTFRKRKEKAGKPGHGATGRVVSEVLDGSLIERNTTAKVIPFIIYLSGLALFLIFNTYYAEKRAGEFERLTNEITALRIQYVHTKSQYMYLTNRSELAQRLSQSGFIEPLEPPFYVYGHQEKRRLFQRIFGNRQ